MDAGRVVGVQDGCCVCGGAMLTYFHRSAPWTRDPWRTRLDGEQWIGNSTALLMRESVFLFFSLRPLPRCLLFFS